MPIQSGLYHEISHGIQIRVTSRQLLYGFAFLPRIVFV
jgi:hypothetical protein